MSRARRGPRRRGLPRAPALRLCRQAAAHPLPAAGPGRSGWMGRVAVDGAVGAQGLCGVVRILRVIVCVRVCP